MTPAEYRAAREKLGTQPEVAALLGVTPGTLSKRERGEPGYPITREAELAIKALLAAKR